LFNLPRGSSLWTNLRESTFMVVSIASTTGFANADYEYWPYVTQGMLFLLMFVGGCAGSTAGGIKMVRVVLLLKHAALQARRLIHPRQVLLLKLDRRPVSADTMQDVLSLTVLYLGVYAAATLVLATAGVDLITGGSSVVACMSTVGPGFGNVGPTENYAGLPAVAKLVLSLCMLLGRLEIFTALVLCMPSLWKR
jgi:trk system potassium uptake protein TrkH